MENYASQQGFVSECSILFTDINRLLGQMKQFEPNAANVAGARKLMRVDDFISQEIEVIRQTPEYDDPATPEDESKNGMDEDEDGFIDDKGFDYSQYAHPVQYAYCSDRYANFSNPFCQRWDAGWDFEESAQNYINRFDRDYIFDHYRRDGLVLPGGVNPMGYWQRLIGRTLIPLTRMFRYYLFTRRSAFEADLYEDWAEAAYRGINFLERIIQAPEPGTYCLDPDDNVYRLRRSNQSECLEEFEVGLGYGQGRFLNSAWTNEYDYKTTRIGDFYDKLAAAIIMTTSTGVFARDLSDLFDRRAFSLGYLRVYLDPMVQRYASLIEGNHEGYRSHVVTDESGEQFVRYMPLFDEEREDGSSVRQWLTQHPEIEPSWSWALQYYSLAFAISNWSSVNDYSPEFYRFTKIAIAGTPEDVTYPENVEVVSFTDPETLITYRAPVIEPFVEGGLLQEFPAYYGDRFHQRQGQFRNWGIGANILQRANDYLTNDWEPAKAGCQDGAFVGPLADGNRWETQEQACQFYEVARNHLNEQVGFINQVRRFNRRAESLNPDAE
jgi:hypothetical protein